MKIIDNKQLIPSTQKDVIIRISREHPSGKSLFNVINDLIIQLSISNTESIDFDAYTRNATLSVFEYTATKNDFEFVIYHEFFHIADRLNPKFKYSENIKNSLNEDERLCAMELWNLYINTRLNNKELFKITEKSCCLKIDNKYKIFRNNTIDKNLLVVADFLKNRGLNNVKIIVKEIWRKPDKHLSYEDIINIIKNNQKK